MALQKYTNHLMIGSERTMISTYLYYDHKRSFTTRAFCDNLIDILGRYGYFDITGIEIGKCKLIGGIIEDSAIKLNKKALATMDLKQHLFEWICDDEVSYLSLIHHENRKWMWDITWHKQYGVMESQSEGKNFCFLQIYSDYEIVREGEEQAAFINLFCDLADLFEAFYGRIEDVSTAVALVEKTRKKAFDPRKPHIAYWGNYFSKCDHTFSQLQKELFAIVRETTNGVFLAATANPMDMKCGVDKKIRRKMAKCLF